MEASDVIRGAVNRKKISAALQSGRAPLWIGLMTLIMLSWIRLVHMNAGMPTMPNMMAMDGRHMMTAGGINGNLLSAFGMWSVMMVAMMLPTEMRSVSVYLALAGRRHPTRSANISATLFVTGYLAVWIGYAAIAAVAQSMLARTMMLAPMTDARTALNAAILLMAGAFQFSRTKNACLARCRAPLAFFLAEWRDGNVGAFNLGLHHGSYCAGCCWALMALMFVVGTMNLLGMGVLMIFMLGEKLAPPAWRLGHAAGVAFLLWGIITVAALVH
jgi:predicted metal-binding membrane protein